MTLYGHAGADYRFSRLLVALGTVQEDRRQLAKAEATAREALAVDSEYVPAHLLMGHLKFRLGMPQAGLRSYRTAHDLAPTEPEPQVRLVEGMMDNGMVAEAEDQCLMFLAENGTNTDLWLVPAGGGEPRRLTDNPAADWQPLWHPDGR